MRSFVCLLKIRKRVHLYVAVACFRLLPMKDYLNPSLVSRLTPFAFLYAVFATPLATDPKLSERKRERTTKNGQSEQDRKKGCGCKMHSIWRFSFYEDVTHNVSSFIPAFCFCKNKGDLINLFCRFDHEIVRSIEMPANR